MAPKRKAANSEKKLKGAAKEDLSQLFLSTLKLLNELDADNGRPLIEPFVKVPSKKLYPDYYLLIKNPISISDIQKNLQKGDYANSQSEFLSDFQLLLDNALSYNDPESWIVSDARKIYEFVKDQVDGFQSSLEPPTKSKKAAGDQAVTNANLPKRCVDILKEVIGHEFPEIGVISAPFLEDIDPEEYPEYFKVIKNPTSFNSVKRKIEKGKLFSPKSSVLENIRKFHDATSLIFSNAQTFNDPSSLIHQDATALKAHFEKLYAQLQVDVEPLKEKKGGLKLKLKTSQEPTPKLKLSVSSNSEKKSSNVKDEHVDEIDEDNVFLDELEDDDDDESGIETEHRVQKRDDVAVTGAPVASSFNIMGKGDPLLLENEQFIQECFLSTSVSQLSILTQQMNQKNQQIQNSQSLRRSELVKALLFPTHSFAAITALFDYKFVNNGFSSLTYSVTLLPETSPMLTFKAILHPLLLVSKTESTGRSISAMNNDAFQCKMFLNDTEITTSGDLLDEAGALLGVMYDLKLSYGLNIILFECKAAPSLSKSIRKNYSNTEGDDVQGRHTRHQLQQIKMTWDVDRVKMYVVCNSI